jgi:hypothetical protein
LRKHALLRAGQAKRQGRQQALDLASGTGQRRRAMPLQGDALPAQAEVMGQ